MLKGKAHLVEGRGQRRETKKAKHRTLNFHLPTLNSEAGGQRLITKVSHLYGSITGRRLINLTCTISASLSTGYIQS